MKRVMKSGLMKAAAVAGILALVPLNGAAAATAGIDDTALKFFGGAFDPASSIDVCGLTGAYTPVEDGAMDGYGDAYDGGLALAFDGSVFDDPDDLGAYANNTLKVGPDTLGDLLVRRTDTALKNGAILRDLVILKNPTASPVSGVVTVAYNFGSDGDTGYMETSSGDNLVTPADRWFITVEDAGSDPINTTVAYGKGAVKAKVDSVVTGVDGNDCLKYTMNVTVPANGTRYLLFFAEMHDSTMDGALDSEEDVKAYNRPGLNESLLAGLKTGVRSKVLNFVL